MFLILFLLYNSNTREGKKEPLPLWEESEFPLHGVELGCEGAGHSLLEYSLFSRVDLT